MRVKFWKDEDGNLCLVVDRVIGAEKPSQQVRKVPWEQRRKAFEDLIAEVDEIEKPARAPHRTDAS